MNGGIDTLRNDIKSYASTVSLNGKRKFVILDEADYLNPQSTQPALRNFMEEYSKNCGFILTANYKNRIIDPLHSRCSMVEFNIGKQDKPKLATQFMKRVKEILKEEKVEYTDNVIAELIMKHFPDWRRVINELQRYSSDGKIDVGILTWLGSDGSFNTLVQYLKKKEFNQMRKWVAENLDNDPTTIYRKLYDSCNVNMKEATIPILVTTIASLQAARAFLKPSSTPAGQSTKTKSKFSLSSSLIFFISSGFIQSNILGSPAGRRARLGSFLCLTNAWSRRQFLSRTS